MGFSSGRKVVFAALLVLLVGCGGGGGGSSGSPPISSGGHTSGWNKASAIGNVRDNFYSFYSPMVAQNAAGDAMAVWLERHSGGLVVWAARYHGSAWGVAQALNTATLVTASDPRVALDANGRAVVVWSGMNGATATDHVPVKAIYFNGSTWGTETRLNVDPGTDQLVASLPDVAVKDAGRFEAVWQQTVAGGVSSIWSSEFDGSNWSSPALRSDGIHACDEPRIAGTGAGGAIAVWRQDNGSAADIYALRHSNGNWDLGATLISNAHSGTNFAESPRIAINTIGNAVVAWLDGVSGETSIQASIFDPTAATSPWSDPETLESNPEAASFPDVAIDPAGNAFVVWRQKTTSFVDGQMARYVAGTGWTKGIDFESQDTDIDLSHVGVDDSGNATVLWSQFSPYDLRARRLPANGSWETEAGIATAGTEALSVNANGQVVVIYRQFLGSFFDSAMYARVFTP